MTPISKAQRRVLEALRDGCILRIDGYGKKSHPRVYIASNAYFRVSPKIFSELMENEYIKQIDVPVKGFTITDKGREALENAESS